MSSRATMVSVVVVGAMPFLPAALGGAFPCAALGGAAMFASAARAPFMGEFSGALDMANRGR